ncbi:MAG: type III-B CRISPR-associated protein Cas10/Cmr2 [Candidatus Accumulibacter phosphatis]|jgi:CRISPR-associated protein Cmr2|nr:type III-B CRISPR-associated protein Cas10/Cmr2 [Candidatus Accumulibacter contiguus]HRE87051.1 type III-B CRISPR-associated protein Cas10/Cmr2 [Accumulibacter sp.]HRF12799.1 type III-B CRISPR-associated protein Cas10/Cmr2 [Candidatus Accumulibacter phosphatis]
MTQSIHSLWKKKLAAWLHDPAEKALVLMRDDVGHEHGSVKTLRERLGINDADFDRRADRFAAAADRPQWPCEPGRMRPAWANVRFANQPLLIHPLSGEEIDLGSLDDIAAKHIRTVSLDHFSDLIERDAHGEPDLRLTYLAFWRFGPEPALVAPEIGDLWRVLPADTRVPDHSIWSHLDTVSALAGALTDDAPALLSMSFGPVQGFIAQARSTSDLWAGSHLLSSLVWEGLKVICAALGPDAIAFPSLRGVAAVDRWLLEVADADGRGEQWRQRFTTIDAEWLQRTTDANPLFAATLPNKFMAIVPARQAEQLARQVVEAVRDAARAWAAEAAQHVLDDRDQGQHWQEQLDSQLAGFPEAQWAIAEWPTGSDRDRLPDADRLRQALAGYGTDSLFGEEVWKVLNREVRIDGAEFFKPNAGIVYPAVHELAERSLAAAKSLRPFAPLPQHGHRCTLCGEREWLTETAAQLHVPAGERRETPWLRKAQAGRFGIRKGEHLCGVCTLKRLWPTLFVEGLGELLDERPARFVISTHTMALATSLDRLVENYKPESLAGLSALSRKFALLDYPPVALPNALHRRLSSLRPATVVDIVKRLPSALDEARNEDAEERLAAGIAELLGARPETYYALIQMDGDHMGAWLAGNDPDYQCRFPATWHPQVRASLDRFRGDPAVAAYLDSSRPASPARHAAISAALNDFSTHVARHIVENVCKGKLLYAGGDDVLAMLSVDDLMPAMLLLRAAWSGSGDLRGLPGHIDVRGLQLAKGYARLKGRLMPMMGSRASASIGAVVAHHQAPLSAVLRELRRAEAVAKAHGRNAFCLRVIKRGGGEVGVTSRFWEMPRAVGATPAAPLLADTALGLLLRFAETLAQPEMSRRAVYNTLEWLSGLPERGGKDMSEEAWRHLLASNLAWQIERQGGVVQHAREFVDLACRESAKPAETIRVLGDLLVTAEFFARNGRAFGRAAAQAGAPR